MLIYESKLEAKCAEQKFFKFLISTLKAVVYRDQLSKT